MKTTPGLLLLAGLLASSSAVAGTVYRCDTPEGRSYVSKRIKGASCEAISQYVPARRSRSGTPAVGAVTPVNLVAGSPASGSVPPASFGASSPAPQAPKPASVAPAVATPAANAPRLVQGQVYSYVKDGVRHYSSKRPQGIASAEGVRTIRYSYMESCFACGARPGVNFGKVRLRMDAYNDEITAAAAQFGVDEAIVRAIIHAESSFNPNALSRVGAQGLMQLMPATARRFGVSNAFDPAQNIRGGVQYLAWLLKRFNGNLTLAAAGYNAGEGAVDRYKGVPPYNETQRYVVRVAQLAERYRGATVRR